MVGPALGLRPTYAHRFLDITAAREQHSRRDGARSETPADLLESGHSPTSPIRVIMHRQGKGDARSHNIYPSVHCIERTLSWEFSHHRTPDFSVRLVLDCHGFCTCAGRGLRRDVSFYGLDRLDDGPLGGAVTFGGKR